MLKNLKKTLNTSASATAYSPATVELANDQEHRKWLKEREALGRVSPVAQSEPLNDGQEDPAALSRGASFRLLAGKDQMPAKSLGSKKLGSVVNRIRLITRSRRNKHLAALKFSSQKHELEEQKFRQMLEQQQQQQQQSDNLQNTNRIQETNEIDDDDDDDDQLSYYSALDYFATGEESFQDTNCLNEQNSSMEPSSSVGTTTNFFAGFKQQGDKYILPEEDCDIPTFLRTQNCDRQLIDETRRLLMERHEQNPDSFYDHDYELMLNDDWTVTRFLLRRRLDPKRTAKLMEECGKFRRQYLMSEMQMWEFPREFYQAGGLFKYMPDRAGNQTLFMRVRMYRKVPEISEVFKAWILCILEECDKANGGRGTAVIFDLSGAGLQNVDLSFLFWLLDSFRNYCPKGVSYIIVYNLPWFFSATCKLAMTWMSATNRRALRFVQGDEIKNFIAPENLPDYLGGTCTKNYRSIPAGSKPAVDVCERLDITKQQALKIKEIFKEYLNDDDASDHEEDRDSIYGDVRDHSQQVEGNNNNNPSIGSTSKASTARMTDSLAKLRATSQHNNNGNQNNARRPAAPSRSSSSDSLVPVVNLVTKASKFAH